MFAVLVEQMKFAEEAELIAMLYICLILIVQPEEAIALVAGIEPISDMCTNSVVSANKLLGEIIRHKLYRPVVVRPAKIKHMIRRRPAVDQEIEVAKNRSEGNSASGLARKAKGLAHIDRLVATFVYPYTFPAVRLILEPDAEDETGVRHVALIHAPRWEVARSRICCREVVWC